MREEDKNHAGESTLPFTIDPHPSAGGKEGRGEGKALSGPPMPRVCRARDAVNAATRIETRAGAALARAPEVHCPHCGGGSGIVLARRCDKGVPGSVSFVDKPRIIAIARRSASHSHEARRARSACGTWKIIINRINWAAARTCVCETSSLLE